MGITFIIVAGITIISVIAVVGDYLTKTKKMAATDSPSELRELRNRVEALERQAEERESRIGRLEGDVAFTTRLLEVKHEGGAS